MKIAVVGLGYVGSFVENQINKRDDVKNRKHKNILLYGSIEDWKNLERSK